MTVLLQIAIGCIALSTLVVLVMLICEWSSLRLARLRRYGSLIAAGIFLLLFSAMELETTHQSVATHQTRFYKGAIFTPEQGYLVSALSFILGTFCIAISLRHLRRDHDPSTATPTV